MDNEKVAKRFFCECGKSYQFNSGLSKHKKKCSKIMVIADGHNLKKGSTLFSHLKKGTTLSEKKEKQDDDISLKEILMQQLKQQNEISDVGDLQFFLGPAGSGKLCF